MIHLWGFQFSILLGLQLIAVRPARETLESGKMNVAQKSLIDPQKIFLPGLHIKLGILKNFIKMLNENGEAVLFFLKPNSLSLVKLKLGREFLMNQKSGK